MPYQFHEDQRRGWVGALIHLHKTHRRHTDGRKSVEVDGRTVGQCIEELVNLYPGLKEALLDAKGGLKNTIEVYLNLESAYPDELKRPVKDGDDIHLTLMIAGG